MTRTALPALNRRFAAKGWPLELVKGEGYFYFVYDDGGKIYETRSVYVNSLNQLQPEQWMEDATGFVADMESKKE